jgi:DNA invertase Pin-like site-specific DNA recombinase
MQPLMYGYMRVSHDADDQQVMRMERELRASAKDRGYDFATIFYEHFPGSHAAFDELIAELQRADAHYVVVPSFDHLAMSAILQNSMLAMLEHDADAEVLELSELSGTR